MRRIRHILNNLNRSVFAALVATFAIAIAVVAPTSVAAAATPNTPSDYYASYNGSDQAVETQNAPIPTSGDFTVEAWVYDTLPTSSGDGTIMSQGNNASAGNNFYLANSNGNKNIRVGDSWTPVYTGTSLNVTWPMNQWFHIAVTNGGTTQKLFINGELVSQASGLDITPATSNFRIGRMYGAYTEYWKGKIDEVKIWNTDRSSSITNDMNTRADLNASGLVSYFDFNAGSDRVIANMKSGSAQSSNGYFGGTAPVYTDVKSVTTRSGSTRAKVVSFERTYLPSSGGWVVPQGVTQVQTLTVGGGGGGGANYGGGGGWARVGVRGMSAFSVEQREHLKLRFITNWLKQLRFLSTSSFHVSIRPLKIVKRRSIYRGCVMKTIFGKTQQSKIPDFSALVI
jgi:hypothetical protein